MSISNKKKIGLYGGTFNPVHFGHLNLAIELKEKKGLDEVWVIPSHLSPFRTHEPHILPQHRLNLTKLAFSDIPNFKILDIELNRPPPSYTIDTVKKILTEYPDEAFFLFLGEDALLRFSEWKNTEELIELIPLLIGSRSPPLSLDTFDEKIREIILQSLIQTRQMEISSTEVRERLKKRQYCGHLLPGKVLDYISAHQLYFDA